MEELSRAVVERVEREFASDRRTVYEWLKFFTVPAHPQACAVVHHSILDYAEGDLERFIRGCGIIEYYARGRIDGGSGESLPQYLQYLPSKRTLSLALAQDRTACPRRHCWWWRSLHFEWNIDVSVGCDFDERGVRVEWPNHESPCRRKDPLSAVDHFEPREPHMMEDGFPLDYWTPGPPRSSAEGAS